MAVVTSDKQIDQLLSADFLAHLDTQLESAERLLAIVVEQGAAIRKRDVQNVVRLAGALQVEMHRREAIEDERVLLLERAAAQLQIGPGDVSLSLIEGLMDSASGEAARERSAALRGMLGVIQQEHRTNRLLMQQELAFLDHLLRLAGGPGGYDADGEHRGSRGGGAHGRPRVFDVEA